MLRDIVATDKMGIDRLIDMKMFQKAFFQRNVVCTRPLLCLLLYKMVDG